MNTESTNPEPLNIVEAWQNFEVNHKNQLSLNEKNELILMANDFRKEKSLGHLSPEQWPATIEKLQNNLSQLQSAAAALQQEWEQATEKLNVKTSLFQFEKKLQSTDAIGDYSSFQNKIKDYHQGIDAIYESNAQARQALVDEALSLVEKEEWQAVTEQYKDLLERWKTAPEVKKHVNEKMWAQINQAKDTFFERKRKHYEDLEKEHLVNWDKKLELCEKAEALQHSEDWKNTTDQMNELFEAWKAIGHLTSQEKSDEMWERFSNARKVFFHRKHEHSKQIKEEQEKNTQDKLAIVEEAEQIVANQNFKHGGERMEALQKQWDAIGRATKEMNDVLWDRWKHARNSFYEQKRNSTKVFLSNLQENYEKKKVLTERAEHLSNSQNWKLATDELLQMMTEWKTIGPIPKEFGDELWDRFNAARRKFFKRKDDDRDRRQAHFKQKQNDRLKQTEQFLETLHADMKEDEEKLSEFTVAIQELKEDNKKDIELKQHLTQLIEKLNVDIEKRKSKIADVEQQLNSLKSES